MMQWGIESIAAMSAAQLGTAALGETARNAPQKGDAPRVFADLLQRELSDLNASVGAAEIAMRDLAAGKPLELHELMISLERARMSVQTFVHLRNKLVESYQDLMRMQL